MLVPIPHGAPRYASRLDYLTWPRGLLDKGLSRPEPAGALASDSARFSRPDNIIERVIPSALEIFARFEKLMLDSPRSIVPMNVR